MAALPDCEHLPDNLDVLGTERNITGRKQILKLTKIYGFPSKNFCALKNPVKIKFLMGTDEMMPRHEKAEANGKNHCQQLLSRFKPHDIPVLVARGFLKPLGRPTPNSEKYFARTQLLKVENDEEWLSRATAAVKQHWREKNARNYKPRISANQH